MKNLSNSLFQKNEIEKKAMRNVFGGASPTTKHDPTWTSPGNGSGHYECDHSADESKEASMAGM